jgi:(1->4)-alpha-D-glucan 1-alpha-D-glucosylmutase
MNSANEASKLFAAVRQRVEPFRRPESTYRLQFHAGFTFEDAAGIVPYLSNLGVTHGYASPFLKSRAGSTHGYDIVDHNSFNLEIGSEDDFRRYANALREHGMGQIIDIVPNHMGVGTNDNLWWNDVLENGPASRFSTYFDIAWQASPRPELQDKVLLPVLGEPYGDAIEDGKLTLRFEEGEFAIHYYDRRLPVSPRSYAIILEQRLQELEVALDSDNGALLEYQSIVAACRNLPRHTETSPEQVTTRWRERQVICRRLADLCGRSRTICDFIAGNVALFNAGSSGLTSFDSMDELLEHQCYRLSYWRVASDEINYRRFFDINDLAALSMERREIFDATHALIFRLLADGLVSGLRIDHPDGLYDPDQYFKRLQESYLLILSRQLFDDSRSATGLEWNDMEEPLRHEISRFIAHAERSEWPLYVVAEKILAADEELIETWAVHGTSGYDFVGEANSLFVDSRNAAAFTKHYRDLWDDYLPFSQIVYRQRLLILETSLASELSMLTHQLDRLAQKNRKSRDFTFSVLRRALREVIACFAVYRSYFAEGRGRTIDREEIRKAIDLAWRRNPLMGRRVFGFLCGMLLLEYPESFTDADCEDQRRFVGKFQQVTSPVAAKAVEDTAFYVYNRLVSLNEVGSDPGRFGVAPQALHEYNLRRQSKWPYALSPLSTHDTKRSEDVRARINALSEVPDVWMEKVDLWSRLNSAHRVEVNKRAAPDANEEYLLYQTLIGAWPLDPCPPPEYGIFVQRVQAYMEKALHEAKVHTSWINPHDEYDAAVRSFVAKVLDEGNAEFLEDFRNFQRSVSEWGLYNSLAQTVLQLASPGASDIYQGTELWDFSLVDPDNRRPVDFAHRGFSRTGRPGRVISLHPRLIRQPGRQNFLSSNGPTAGGRVYWATWTHSKSSSLPSVPVSLWPVPNGRPRRSPVGKMRLTFPAVPNARPHLDSPCDHLGNGSGCGSRSRVLNLSSNRAGRYSRDTGLAACGRLKLAATGR